MALPSLDALLATGCPVTVCARPWAHDLLKGYDLAGFVAMDASWNQNRKRLKSHIEATDGGRPPRLGLLLPDSLSSALTFRLAGLRSAGYIDDGRRFLLKWPITKPAAPLHAVESWYYLTRIALQRWGLTVPPEHPARTLGLKLTKEHEIQAQQCLQQATLPSGRFIVIAPTATGQHKGRVKVWPGFDTLTRALQRDGHTVVMAPPKAEREQAVRNAPTAICLEPLGLGAFATLTREAAVVICNDSGVSHIAAAAGARQITLFGVTEQARTGPWSDTAVCMGAMNQWPDVEAVLKKTRELLSSNIIHHSYA